MANHHITTHLASGDVAAAWAEGDSFSDESVVTVGVAGVDGVPPVDSALDGIRSDIPMRLDGLLPGEAALVYQFLRNRLATLFDADGD